MLFGKEHVCICVHSKSTILTVLQNYVPFGGRVRSFLVLRNRRNLWHCLARSHLSVCSELLGPGERLRGLRGAWLRLLYLLRKRTLSFGFFLLSLLLCNLVFDFLLDIFGLGLQLSEEATDLLQDRHFLFLGRLLLSRRPPSPQG